MAEAQRSTSFDAVADCYDRTRALPDDAARAFTEALAAELTGRGRCLEIGVGTGRIALPLARRELPMAGVDLSAPMLSRLVRNAGGRAPFPLARADVAALPFGQGRFGAALAVHVLHLVPQWRRAVAELVRVVRPGGLLLVDAGGASQGVQDAVGARFAAEADLPDYPGMRDAEELDGLLEARGARRRLLAPVRVEQHRSPESVIAELEAGIFSRTWTVTPETRRRAAAATREWAADALGDLAAPRTVIEEIVVRAYDLPG